MRDAIVHGGMGYFLYNVMVDNYERGRDAWCSECWIVEMGWGDGKWHWFHPPMRVVTHMVSITWIGELILRGWDGALGS